MISLELLVYVTVAVLFGCVYAAIKVVRDGIRTTRMEELWQRPER